jgi:hypothetical protein
MKLRFVDGGTVLSGLIKAREGVCYPFTPSHVEIVVAEGYLGAVEQLMGASGVAIRPVGYDARFKQEAFVTVKLPDEAGAEAWARSKIGTPYDWAALFDFVLPINVNEARHLICSAFALLALRTGKLWTPHQIAVPAHGISPRDLLLVLSSQSFDVVSL